jgi:hypothetical protein
MASIAPDTACRLCRLLHTLVRGERVAHEAAGWKARAESEPRSRQFSLAQAAQERFHAHRFNGAALWVAPKVSSSRSRTAALGRYHRRLERAMLRRRMLEVVVGQQIVLEGPGEPVLARLAAEIDRRGLGFERLRRIVLRQERAHPAFGTRMIARAIEHGRAVPAGLATLAGGDVEHPDDVLTEVSPLLESLGEDAEAYRREARLGLPSRAVGRAG